MGRILCVTAAATVLLVAACGAKGDDQPAATATKTVTVPPASGPVTTTQIADQSWSLDKQIGEQASTDCPEDPAQPCDVDFTVTAIQPNAPCPGPFAPAGPDEQYLRFDLTATSTVDRFRYGDGMGLMLSNWGVETADGLFVQDLKINTECGKGSAGISRPIVPGTRTETSVVVTAPKSAKVLRLDWAETSWKWQIPGA
jgi:hypothetical protein